MKPRFLVYMVFWLMALALFAWDPIGRALGLSSAGKVLVALFLVLLGSVLGRLPMRDAVRAIRHPIEAMRTALKLDRQE